MDRRFDCVATKLVILVVAGASSKLESNARGATAINSGNDEAWRYHRLAFYVLHPLSKNARNASVFQHLCSNPFNPVDTIYLA